MATPKVVIEGSSNVTAPQMRDLFKQIANHDLDGYHVQAFLEHRNPFEVVYPKIGFELEVDYGQPLKTMMDAGNFRWREQEIVDEKFGLAGRGKRKERLFICQCDRPMSTDEVEKALAKFGRSPGNIYQMLALILAHPDTLTEYPMVALASKTWRGNEVTRAGFYVPQAYEGKSGRHLLLRRTESDLWRSTHQFLAVERTREIASSPFGAKTH